MFLKSGEENDMTHIIAEVDEPRSFKPYLSDVDINGKYVILNTDNERYSVIKTIDQNELGQIVNRQTPLS